MAACYTRPIHGGRRTHSAWWRLSVHSRVGEDIRRHGHVLLVLMLVLVRPVRGAVVAEIHGGVSCWVLGAGCWVLALGELGRRLRRGLGLVVRCLGVLFGGERDEARAVVTPILQSECVLTAEDLDLITQRNGEGVELRRARLLPPAPERHQPSPHHPRHRLGRLITLAAFAAHLPARPLAVSAARRPSCMHACASCCLPCLPRLRCLPGHAKPVVSPPQRQPFTTTHLRSPPPRCNHTQHCSHSPTSPCLADLRWPLALEISLRRPR